MIAGNAGNLLYFNAAAIMIAWAPTHSIRRRWFIAFSLSLLNSTVLALTINIAAGLI